MPTRPHLRRRHQLRPTTGPSAGAGALAAAAVLLAGAAGCSGTRENPVEGEGRTPQTSQTTATVRGETTTPVESDDPQVPDGAPTGPLGASGQDQGGSTSGSTVLGAEPGQDIDDLQPPGGTFEVDDPGGDSESDPAPGNGG